MKLPRLHQNTGSVTDPGQYARAPAWQAWLETAGLVAAAIAIGALVDRTDPFLLRRGFSWLIVAPLLAGLQYGSTHGLGGAAIQALALLLAWKSGLAVVPDSAAETVLGWLLAGLAAGEFRDAWRRRLGQLEGFGDHLRSRLESLGRSYLALKISHDRLQRAAPAASPTLREALSAFRRDVAERRAEDPLDAFADRILAIFSEHAFVRAATLHRVDRRGRPGPAIARLGAAAPAECDPLVSRAARTGLTVSIRDCLDATAVLVAIPLVDIQCRAQAVVAVHDMPFLSLQTETLELLAILGGRLGETISRARAPSRPMVEPSATPATPLPSAETTALPAPAKEVA